MSDIDELRQRVEAAEQRFGLIDEQHRNYSERLLDLINAVEEALAQKQAEIEQHQARSERADHENEELRRMLFSLLQAIEGGNRDRLGKILHELDAKISALLGGGSATPAAEASEPAPAPESAEQEPAEEPAAMTEEVPEEDEVAAEAPPAEALEDEPIAEEAEAETLEAEPVAEAPEAEAEDVAETEMAEAAPEEVAEMEMTEAAPEEVAETEPAEQPAAETAAEEAPEETPEETPDDAPMTVWSDGELPEEDMPAGVKDIMDRLTKMSAEIAKTQKAMVTKRAAAEPAAEEDAASEDGPQAAAS